MSVSVVIPTFNRRRGLDTVLRAIAGQSVPPLEVVLIDNASSDGTEAAVPALARLLPMPLVYRRKEPEGPAAARNLGTGIATGEYVLYLDSDVELAPDWIEVALAHFADAPKLAAVGGKVLYANDSDFVNSYGGCLSRLGLAWDAREGEAARDVTEVEARLWINCSAVLMRRAAVQEVGGFDPRFFYAFEDSDLGWRLALAGWDQICVPEASVLHHVGDEIGASGPAIVRHYTKNRLASLIANMPGPAVWPWGALAVLYALADIVRRGPRDAKLAGLWWNVTHLRGTLARRRQIMAIRRRSAVELGALFAPGLFPPSPLAGMRRRPNRAQVVTRDAAGDDRV